MLTILAFNQSTHFLTPFFNYIIISNYCQIESSKYADACAVKLLSIVTNFEAVIVIGNIKEEVRNDEPTGRLIVKGILVQYGERADVVDFIVASTDAINHIQTYWNEGDTVRVAGKVNFSSRVIHEEKEVGFGDPIIEDRTISVKELIITSGSQSALDGDLAYEADEIREALKRRQATLDEQKDNASKKEAAPAEKKSTDFGF